MKEFEANSPTMPVLTLVILAAGMGSRYGSLKQVDPVGPHGELLLHYSIYDALLSGFGKIVLVIRPEILDEFHDRFGRSIEERCEIAYVLQRSDDLPEQITQRVERTKPWGTAHAVWCCRKEVQTPFAVLNADDFYGRSSLMVLANAMRALRPGAEMIHMVGFRLESTLSQYGSVARAVCDVDKNGYLTRIVERKRIEKHQQGCVFTEDTQTWHPIAGDTIVSMNLWGFPHLFFEWLEKSLERFFSQKGVDFLHEEIYLPGVVNDLIAGSKTRVKVLRSNDSWFGMTYPQDRSKAQEALLRMHQSGIYPEKLFNHAQ